MLKRHNGALAAVLVPEGYDKSVPRSEANYEAIVSLLFGAHPGLVRHYLHAVYLGIPRRLRRVLSLQPVGIPPEVVRHVLPFIVLINRESCVDALPGVAYNVLRCSTCGLRKRAIFGRSLRQFLYCIFAFTVGKLVPGYVLLDRQSILCYSICRDGCSAAVGSRRRVLGFHCSRLFFCNSGRLQIQDVVQYHAAVFP